MQIQLCEDDGMFHGGIPQIVVLVVKFDDGKTKRIPYPADKTISSLYQDLQAISPRIVNEPLLQLDIPEWKEVQEVSKPSIIPKNATSGQIKPIPIAIDRSNVIEKEDIVTMVKKYERKDTFSGTESPLMIGMDYRVLKVIGPTVPTRDGKGVKKIIEGFEVIDDTAPTPERMIVLPDEVVLKNKRLSPIVEKVMSVEEILHCPHCDASNSLALAGDDFKGVCSGCGLDIVISRVIKKCETVSCKKEGISVSCFDVGGKYEGHCGTCGSVIEVPYA